MKKHLTQLLLSLLFLVVTAMTCDEQDWAEPIDISCTLKEVELYHWDNAGEKPKEAVDNKVLKEAYMMEIRLLTDAGEKDPESHDADHYLRHVLSDGIKRFRYLRKQLLMKNFPQGQKSLPAFMTIRRRLLKISRQILLLMEELYP